MRRLILVLFLLSALGAFAQSAHNVSLTWSASADAAANPTLTYNVYRAPEACPAGNVIPSNGVKVGNVPTPGYNDTAVLVGQSYCYFVTAALNGGESAPSNTAGGTIPIAAPGSVVITIK